MPFQKGRAKTGGRKPSIKTQLKRFEERHPEAYDALMEILYEKGLEGSSNDAQYVVDRIKGKAKAATEVEITGGQLLGTGLVTELYTMLAEQRRKLLAGGEDENKGTAQGIYEGVYEEKKS